MDSDSSQLPDISTYVDLLDQFGERKTTAPEFESAYLRMMKCELRTLGEPVYPLLQELFEDADAYVERPELRTDREDLDDEQLLGCAVRTRQALRELGYE